MRDLIDFVAHVADCFKEETEGFAGDLISILTLHHAALEPELREKIVGSLVLLRRKDVIDSSTLGSPFVSMIFANHRPQSAQGCTLPGAHIYW